MNNFYRILFFVFSSLILFSLNLKAENSTIIDGDSLMKKADSYRESDRGKNKYYLNRAFDFYNNENNKTGLAKINNKLSKWYSDENQIDTALGLALDALKYADELGDSLLSSEVYLNLGIIYYNLKNDKISKQYYLDAITYGSIFVKASATANIGLIYSDNNIEDTALIFFKKANRIFLSMKDTSSKVLSNIATTNMNM